LTRLLDTHRAKGHQKLKAKLLKDAKLDTHVADDTMLSCMEGAALLNGLHKDETAEHVPAREHSDEEHEAIAQFIDSFKNTDTFVLRRDEFSAATGWEYPSWFRAEHELLIQHTIEATKLCTVMTRTDDPSLHELKTGKDLVLTPLSGNDRTGLLTGVTNVRDLASGLLQPMEKVCIE
jgi:hypothetical protein